jgi:hypothetical protein
LSRSRPQAVICETGRWPLRWPAGPSDERPAHGPPGSGCQHRSLRVPGRFPQAQQVAQRPAFGRHDARRRLPPEPRKGNRVVLAGSYPGSTGERETGVISTPLKASSPGCPKAGRCPSSPATGARHPVRVLILHDTYARAGAPGGLQLKLRSQRPMTTGGGHPADGTACTHAARKLLALGGSEPGAANP